MRRSSPAQLALIALAACLLAAAGLFSAGAQNATPEATPEATAPAAATPEATAIVLTEDLSYTVVRGDRLIKLAERYGVTLDCLVRANRIANPNRILIGQRLLIPVSCQELGAGGGEAASPPAATATVTEDGITGGGACAFDRYPGRVAPGGQYTVRAGDTLDYIACDFGIALACLVETNPQIGDNRGRIRAGDRLTISLSCPGWEGPALP